MADAERHRQPGINGTLNGNPFASLNVTGTLTINGLLVANTVNINTSGGIVIPGTLMDAGSISLVSGPAHQRDRHADRRPAVRERGRQRTLTGHGTSNQVAQVNDFRRLARSR